MGFLDDQRLVQQIRSGDEQAFVTLIRRYERSLAALIRDRIGAVDAVEDVLQETLVHAWSGLRDRVSPACAGLALPGRAQPLRRLPALCPTQGAIRRVRGTRNDVEPLRCADGPPTPGSGGRGRCFRSRTREGTGGTQVVLPGWVEHSGNRGPASLSSGNHQAAVVPRQGNGPHRTGRHHE